MKEDFVVCDIHVPQNSKAEAWPKVLELNDTTAIRIPLTIVNGSEPGPIVYVGAGAHGSEYTSILSAIDVAAKLEPERVRGTIIFAPIQNIPAFRERQRNITLNDEEGYNLHRTFPGDPLGGPPFRISHFLFQQLVLDTKVDFAFDLHTCSHTHAGPAHTFVPPRSFGEVAIKAMQAAEVFGTKMVVQDESAWNPLTQRGVYSQTDMPHMVGAKHGIPTLGLELVENKIVSDSDVEEGSQGILNVLKHLGVLEGPLPPKIPQIVINNVVYVRNNHGGIVRQKVNPGDLVKEGDLLVTILDPFGHIVETVRAPVEGYVLTLIAFSSIHEGEMVARIGVEGLR